MLSAQKSSSPPRAFSTALLIRNGACLTAQGINRLSQLILSPYFSLTTAISVLGPERGWELVQGLEDVEVLIVSRQADGPLLERQTPGFAALLATP